MLSFLLIVDAVWVNSYLIVEPVQRLKRSFYQLRNSDFEDDCFRQFAFRRLLIDGSTPGLDWGTAHQFEARTLVQWYSYMPWWKRNISVE